jgi:hypothetical protein
LIRGAQVLTLDPGRPVIPDGAVLVEGDRIDGFKDLSMVIIPLEMARYACLTA